MMAPPPVAQHRLDRELAGQEHAAPIDGHHLVPAGGGHLQRVAERDDAGVGHQHVEPAEVIDRRLNHPPRVRFDRDVADDRLDLRAAAPHLVVERQQRFAVYRLPSGARPRARRARRSPDRCRTPRRSPPPTFRVGVRVLGSCPSSTRPSTSGETVSIAAIPGPFVGNIEPWSTVDVRAVREI